MKQRSGFTIIEVILVMAIAGLIFLMIFIALPALNRAQRDSRRRDDVSILLRKIKDYQTNNRGALPTQLSVFQKEYLGSFADPVGNDYNLTMVTCEAENIRVECKNSIKNTDTFPNDFKMLIVQRATCDGDKAVASKNVRKVAVQYKLEGGGVYCANS